MEQSLIDTFHGFCKQGELKKAKRFMVLNATELTETTVNEGFIFACANGRLAFVIWMILRNPRLDVTWKQNLCFCIALEKGHLDIAQLILSHFPTLDVKTNGNRDFYNICKNGHLECAQWFTSLQEETFSVLGPDHDTFNIVCSHGYEDMILWMIEKSQCGLLSFQLSTNQLLEENGLPMFNHPLSWLFICNHGEILLKICQRFPQWLVELKQNQVLITTLIYYSVITAKKTLFIWLKSLTEETQNDKMTPPDFMDNALFIACSIGDVQMIVLLCNYFEVSLTSVCKGISHACGQGHIHVLHHFYDAYDLANLNTLLRDQYVPLWIVSACKEGSIHIVKWCLEKYPSVESIINWDSLFVILCGYDSYQMVRFLYRKFSNKININNIEAFENACQNCQLQTAQWLYEKNPSFDITQNHHAIIKSIPNDDEGCIEMLQWLCSLRSDIYSLLLNENQKYTVHINIKMNCIKDVELRDELCIICYEKANIQTNCRHCFCDTCLKKCYQISPMCSMCRQTIVHLQKII